MFRDAKPWILVRRARAWLVIVVVLGQSRLSSCGVWAEGGQQRVYVDKIRDYMRPSVHAYGRTSGGPSPFLRLGVQTSKPRLRRRRRNELHFF